MGRISNASRLLSAAKFEPNFETSRFGHFLAFQAKISGFRAPRGSLVDLSISYADMSLEHNSVAFNRPSIGSRTHYQGPKCKPPSPSFANDC